MKYCPAEDCDEQIQDWQQSCYKHSEVKKMDDPTVNPAEHQPGYSGVPEAPQQPGTPQQPAPQETPPAEPVQTTPPVEPVQPPKQKKVIWQEIRQVDERSLLITKQVAFKETMASLRAMEDFETKPYDVLIGEARRMTVDFLKIILEKNEQL